MNLGERVKAIILTPQTEWPVIAREPGGVGHLFRHYVAILAAIPAVANFIGTLLRGGPLLAALAWAIIQYLLAFVFAYVLALVITALAPRFGGAKDFVAANKLAVYSTTAFWLAGAFALVPALAFLAVLGFYGVYLLYTGARPMMGVPPERATAFTVVVFVCALVIMALLTMVPLLQFGPRPVL
jgi:hypothetical protein